MLHPRLRRRRRLLSRLSCLSCLLVGAACGGDPDPSGAADAAGDLVDAAGPATGVDLVRDARGVPHLYAASMQRAMFGLGFASAHDRLFQMVLRRATMRGRLAELFAVPGGTPAADAFNARLIDSDRAVRTLGYASHAEAVAPALPGDVPALLAAYADGVNAYLADPGAVVAPALQALGLGDAPPEPWTPADSLLAWDWVGYHFTSARGALQAELDAYVCASGGACAPTPPCELPIDEDAAVVPPHAEWPPGSGQMVKVAPPGAVVRPDVVIKASHGWVVAGTRTTTGKPVLVGEPQLTLEAPSTWYEAHLSADGVDVRGVGLAGAPGMLVFWNQHLAQTVTAGGADNADLVRLRLSPDGTSYLVDDVARAITSHDESILVRHGEVVPLTVRRTEFGPIVDGILTGGPVGVSFAARLVEQADPSSHSIVAGLEATRATSLATYQAALAHWVSPGVNALYAGVDAGADPADPGHVAYHALLRIPDRVRISRGGRDLTGRFPIDGSTAAAVWTTLLPAAWSPHLVDPPAGYLFSGNHLPVGSWFDGVVYSGLAGNGDTYRSLRVRQRLAELLPPGGAAVTPAAIHAMHVDDQQDAARLLHDLLVYLAGRGVGADPGDVTAEPVDRGQRAARLRLGLTAWLAAGGHLRTRDVRAQVAATMITTLAQLARWQASPVVACRYGGGQGGAAWMLKDFALDPAATTTAAVADLVLRTADAAWTALRPGLPGADPASWDAPVVVADRLIRYQVNFTCLRPGQGGSCSLDPTHETRVGLDAAFVDSLNSAHGSSYPLTVDLADPEATRALLPPGVSEDPASPFFHDGLAAIVAKAAGDADAIPAAPRARATVEASATSSQHLE
jgi:penicillin amidase